MIDKRLVAIRSAIDNDKNALGEICESNAALYDPIMPGAFNKQANKFRVQGIPNSYNVKTIEYDTEIIGFAGILSLSSESAYLVALYLHQKWQRKGLGEFIINNLKNEQKDNGVLDMILLVHSKAEWAKSFYLKNGFESVGIDEKEIRVYKNGIIENLYLPDTELMRSIL